LSDELDILRLFQTKPSAYRSQQPGEAKSCLSEQSKARLQLIVRSAPKFAAASRFLEFV
jgi:hypothetical protein